MTDIDPTTLAAMDAREFHLLLKKLSDKESTSILGGELREPFLDKVFAGFPKFFTPDKAKNANARVNWRITGAPDGGSDTYAVVVADGACHIEKDPTEEPTTSLMAGPAEFVKLVSGSGNPTMMVMMGKVKVRGDLSVVMSFPNWFDTPKS